MAPRPVSGAASQMKRHLAAAAPAVAQKSEQKLLYPIMIQGGPNNQYQQFLESMLLAKALRRKIHAINI